MLNFSNGMACGKSKLLPAFFYISHADQKIRRLTKAYRPKLFQDWYAVHCISRRCLASPMHGSLQICRDLVVDDESSQAQRLVRLLFRFFLFEFGFALHFLLQILEMYIDEKVPFAWLAQAVETLLNALCLWMHLTCRRSSSLALGWKSM